MRPKGKLLALVAMFAAVGLITATGAFTTVEAERTASVDVAGDNNALLQIEAASGAEDYVTDNGGLTEIDIGSQSAGVNDNAITTFDEMLNLTNQGTNDVGLVVEISSDGTAADAFDVINGSNSIVVNDASSASSGDAIDLGSGESQQIGIVVDLVAGQETDLDNLQITIYVSEDLHSGSSS